MRGIVAMGGYVPWWRLQRADIAAAHGGAPGKGARAVGSYDEDTTSMAVEAGRIALRPLGDAGRSVPRIVWFATTAPSYLDKTNATAVHAALRLDRDAAAYDAIGSVRSTAGVLRAALEGDVPTLVTAADRRAGLPNSPDERDGGDGAAAVLVANDPGGDDPGPAVLAEYLGGSSLSEEFVDRWRIPGETRSRQWEERFGETRYGPLATEAWKLALDAAGVGADDVATVVLVGPHTRAVGQAGRKLGAGTGGLADDLAATVGNTGAAHPLLALTNALEGAEPGQVLALVSLADGCDVFVFRATDALASYSPARTVAHQIDTGRPGLPYFKFLSWEGVATIQPPNRPEPARTSSSAAARNTAWKFGFVDDGVPMADATGRIAAFTVDKLVYSPSPPVVFAVVDFDDPAGVRMPLELTDVDADEVAIGDRVEMTFRRLNSAEGIQNYFWKARPAR